MHLREHPDQTVHSFDGHQPTHHDDHDLVVRDSERLTRSSSVSRTKSVEIKAQGHDLEAVPASDPAGQEIVTLEGPERDQ
jgi:hypothetical protein